jgi:ABC-2 type transport system ATP-binding protein
MNTPALEVRDFHKSYGNHTAVAGISFTVAPGEIFGLLGPNGAGKTTTLECLEGLRRADGGTIRVLGLDPAKDFTRLVHSMGVQLQTAALPGHITVGEAVRLFAAYHQVHPDMTLLARLGLEEKLNSQYHSLSTGQQRRLTLALAAQHRPRILFLDEPTAGLDVATRIALHQLVQELRDEGTTIILSTPARAEAEILADRVAILLRGRLAAAGTPRELTAAGQSLTKVSVRTLGASLEGASFAGVEQRDAEAGYAVYFTSSPGPTVAEIIAHVEAAGDELVDLRVERPSLEERFLELTTTSSEEVM